MAKYRRYYVYHGSRDTDVSLKEYIETRIEAMEHALTLAKDAVDKTLAGFPLEYMRKAEYEKAHDQISKAVDEVKRTSDQIGVDIKNNIYPKLENKATQLVATMVISAFVGGLFAAIGGSLIRHLWP